MTVFSFKPGAAAPLAIRPEQDDGTVPDIAGVAMELRIDTGSTCLTLPGVLDPEDQLFEIDVNALDLPPRLYPASVCFDWGDGWVREGIIHLDIERGC